MKCADRHNAATASATGGCPMVKIIRRRNDEQAPSGRRAALSAAVADVNAVALAFVMGTGIVSTALADSPHPPARVPSPECAARVAGPLEREPAAGHAGRPGLLASKGRSRTVGICLAGSGQALCVLPEEACTGGRWSVSGEPGSGGRPLALMPAATGAGAEPSSPLRATAAGRRYAAAVPGSVDRLPGSGRRAGRMPTHSERTRFAPAPSCPIGSALGWFLGHRCRQDHG